MTAGQRCRLQPAALICRLPAAGVPTRENKIKIKKANRSERFPCLVGRRGRRLVPSETRNGRPRRTAVGARLQTMGDGLRETGISRWRCNVQLAVPVLACVWPRQASSGREGEGSHAGHSNPNCAKNCKCALFHPASRESDGGPGLKGARCARAVWGASMQSVRVDWPAGCNLAGEATGGKGRGDPAGSCQAVRALVGLPAERALAASCPSLSAAALRRSISRGEACTRHGAGHGIHGSMPSPSRTRRPPCASVRRRAMARSFC